MQRFQIGVFLTSVFAGSIVFAAPVPSSAPVSASKSYAADCSKVKALIDQQICNSDSLKKLDQVMAQAYSLQIQQLATAEKKDLKKAQKSWLKSRSECIGRLPADEYNCLDAAYQKRIRELKGADLLLKMYKEECIADTWRCVELGKLEIEMERYQDAVKDLEKICNDDRDGDAGYSCYLKGTAYEKSGKQADAINAYKKSCTARNHIEACAAVDRLEGKKSTNTWVGLYRHDRGSLGIREQTDGKLSISIATRWANGHSCNFSGTAEASTTGSVIETIADKSAPGCILQLKREASKITTIDINQNCRGFCGARGTLNDEFELEKMPAKDIKK